jgi:hypothetical protein
MEGGRAQDPRSHRHPHPGRRMRSLDITAGYCGTSGSTAHIPYPIYDKP